MLSILNALEGNTVHIGKRPQQRCIEFQFDKLTRANVSGERIEAEPHRVENSVFSTFFGLVKWYCDEGHANMILLFPVFEGDGEKWGDVGEVSVWQGEVLIDVHQLCQTLL